MSQHLLSLDLGSTSVRALVVAADGSILARAQRPLATTFPTPDRVEQDPEDMWERSREVLGEALRSSGVGASEVAGLGIVTQRGTAIAWDARTGEPLAPALSWQDRRTAAHCAALNRKGIPINSLASATKFQWLTENVGAVQRAALSGTLRLGTPEVWLSARLTGQHAFVTDPGCAGATGLLDAQRTDWHPAILKLFDLEREWLPRVVATTAIEGMTAPDLLGRAVPVAARAGDQQAACFAQGVHGAGEAKLTLGTSAMLDVHTGAAPMRAPDGTYALPLWTLSDDVRAFCLEGTVITAGAAVDWLVELGLLPAPELLDAACGDVENSDGVVFVPALEGLGTPHMDDSVRGLLGGLTRGSTSAHVIRAVVEGIAERCAEVWMALSGALGEQGRDSLRVDGGLARSDALLQELADRIGEPVLRAVECETTALGGAFLSGLATGVFPSLASVRALTALPQRFEPARSESWRDATHDRWQRVLERTRS